MVSVRKICVYGDEGEMRGNVRTFMIHYAIQLGVHLSQVYVHGMCNILYGIIILSVPWYSGHRDRVHVHT